MNEEIILATVLVTVFRLVWILRKPVHKDITSYIFPGLSNLHKIVRYDPGFSYVPYGLIWYAINVPVIRLGRHRGRFWLGTLAVIDGIFLWYSFVSMGLVIFLAYFLIGTFQLLRAPWNVSINWLIVLAPISWVFLILAPIAKFPVGLPLQVWGYTERAIGHQHNYVYFGLLGTLWLVVFNHLYLFPVIDGLLTISSGFLWTLIIGYAYLTRPSRRKKPSQTAHH